MVKYAALALLLVACTPARPPRASVVMRETTAGIKTACPEVPPSLDDPGLEDASKLVNVTIDRICMYGGRVDDLLTFKLNDPITPQNMRAFADAVVKSKRFDDFEVGAETRADGTYVYITTHELPIVEATGERLDPYAVLQLKKTKVAELVEKGFGDAKCESVIEPTERPGYVKVSYKVEPGPLWKIFQLRFMSNGNLTTPELEAASGLSVGDTYDADRVQVAHMHMLDAYYRSGMLKAEIGEPRLDVDFEGKVRLAWSIYEGDIYTVGSIKLGKSAPWMQKELAPLVRLKPHMVFNRQTMAEDLTKMRDLAQTKRKKRIEILPAMTLDGAKKTVDVVLDVEEKD